MDTIDLLTEYRWAATAGLALAAVIAALVFHRVIGGLLRRHTKRSVVLNSVLMAVEKPAGAALPLLALQVVWQIAPGDLAHISTVRHGNGVLLIGALTWAAVAVVSGFAAGVVARNPADAEDNLHARRVQTQAKVLSRSAMVLIIISGAAMALMTFPGARQVGASLLASAGVLGIVGGLAARPVFSNLIAGLQLAVAQPLRMDDVLIVKGEYGRVEEITGTYVVLKLWDERRMIVPLQWFIENPFENWTRSSSQLHQAVYLYVDFATPLEPLRAEVQRVVSSEPEWDGRTATLVAMDATERALKLRVLVSSGTSGTAFDLGCKVREALFALMARDYPQFLPRMRLGDDDDARGMPPAAGAAAAKG
jgi:small-conductance mechanosensitive channel